MTVDLYIPVILRLVEFDRRKLRVRYHLVGCFPQVNLKPISSQLSSSLWHPMCRTYVVWMDEDAPEISIGLCSTVLFGVQLTVYSHLWISWSFRDAWFSTRVRAATMAARARIHTSTRGRTT